MGLQRMCSLHLQAVVLDAVEADVELAKCARCQRCSSQLGEVGPGPLVTAPSSEVQLDQSCEPLQSGVMQCTQLLCLKYAVT